ncbi:SDR family NAD(P)-dependent oxidoreductase [Streptococcus troglodytae]
MMHSKNYVCITGASSGIGLETAKAFASLGSNLILIARRQERLEKLKEELLTSFPKLDIVVKSVDLSISENVFKLYQELKSYQILTWINNAGFGNYDSVDHQNLDKITKMLHLNIEALTILSSLYVKDYKNVEGTQLINLSSRGGYMLVENAVTYCASKFYVSAFTEGLALELAANHCPLKAKVLAPAATKSEFGQVAADTDSYDYDKHFTIYHTSKEMADFLIELYYSDKIVGLVDVNDFNFKLSEPLFKH